MAGSPFDAIMAAGQGAAPSAGPAPAAPTPSGASPFDALMAAAAQEKTTTTQPSGGIGKNVGAGLLDAAANLVNMATDPSGTLGKIPATALVTLHDALAPVFGYNRFTDADRSSLLDDSGGQDGNKLVRAIGGAIGADPSKVTANTDAERLVRKITGAAVLAPLVAPGGAAAALAGGTGAAVGDVAAQAAPSWAAPAAELAGNVVGGGAAVPLARGTASAALAGENALNRLVYGSEDGAAGMNRLTGTPVGGTPAPAAADAQAAAVNTGPSTVGAAAASPEEAAMSPKEAAADQATAEMQKLLEPQEVGVADRNIYVPGVTPTMAEVEQSVNLARELKALGQAFPQVSQDAREIAAASNDARQSYFQQLAGGPADIMRAEGDRSAQAEADLAAAWTDKKAADITPIVNLGADILASPDGRRSVVVSNVNDVLGKLLDGNGDAITDPEILYGVRKHIDDLLSKEAAAGNPQNIRAQANLLALKGELDGVIEQAAPGFGQYLENYASASRPIDEMTALQAVEPKLYDAQNRMTYAKVQQAMKQIVTARQADGINPYKSISDETMQGLWNLRDDLRRSAAAQELARTPGSDTAQNLMDIAKGVGGQLAGHAVAAAVAPGVGNLLFNAAKEAIVNPLVRARAEQKSLSRANALLHPDPSTLRNRLLDQ